MHPTYRVLYVCTGNSARSILAEALTRRLSGGRFEAFSAGADPRGEVHPLALELLRNNDLPTEGLRSKSWHEFAAPDAPPMDFVITVCDRAAGESCPVWPGQPITAQWSVPDPAAVVGSPLAQKAAFRETLFLLQHRISLLTELKAESLDRLALRTRLGDLAGHAGGKRIPGAAS
ncbi:arsenate reductase [Tahibacter aquaticus]|uniref:Arsenate reductase n=1 Tax=Tahibacter aquaticus TaxID=520092 RepID=A0A4R6YT81_9GAMM|nr:arsenate reductase ArsC [Tahibacter aquaticus]TDR41593.1 arsenate reductase [Tahibacter aquaticus]